MKPRKYTDKHIKQAIDFGIGYMVSADHKDITEEGRLSVYREFKRQLEEKIKFEFNPNN